MTPLTRQRDASGAGGVSKHLPTGGSRPTSRPMFTRRQWRWFIDHPVTEWSIFAIGVILIIVGLILNFVPIGGSTRRWY